MKTTSKIILWMLLGTLVAWIVFLCLIPVKQHPYLPHQYYDDEYDESEYIEQLREAEQAKYKDLDTLVFVGFKKAVIIQDKHINICPKDSILYIKPN